MAERNRELEGFSYSVSHDLRAPLRPLTAFRRGCFANSREKLGGEAVGKFNVIRNSTRTMGQLIDDLLDFSRLSRARLSMVELDMGGLFREVWKEADNGGHPQAGFLRSPPSPRAGATGRLSNRCSSTSCRTPSSSPRGGTAR